MKLSRIRLDALRNIAASGKTWTIMMVDDYFTVCNALEKLGLVQFEARVTRRGRGNGSDCVATQKGLQVLKSHGVLPKHREQDLA